MDIGVLFRQYYSIHQRALALDVIQVLDGTISNLAKVSTVPCNFADALFLGQRVDDWLV